MIFSSSFLRIDPHISILASEDKSSLVVQGPIHQKISYIFFFQRDILLVTVLD